MKVLILGSGGREHALAMKIAQSPLVKKIVVAPGNAGMAGTPKVELHPADLKQLESMLSVAELFRPDLVVVGPELPLSLGVTDVLEAKGFSVVAPSKVAAQLEGSKIFSKEFMQEVGIPTARAESFTDYKSALSALEKGHFDFKKGVVVKADGLCEGKGVVVTHDAKIAKETLIDFMQNPACKVKADKIMLEEKVEGKEVSAFALCDGESFVTLGYACDYKLLHDGDKGPNTGGMGGYSPQSWPTTAVKKFVEEKVFKAVVDGMKKRGTSFKGFLFAGLMIDGDAVSVLEFNVRMGDPETQILLPLIEEDLVPYLMASAKGGLATLARFQEPKLCSVHVVMTSQNYAFVDGTKLLLDQEISIAKELDRDPGLKLYYSGVKQNAAGTLVNSGGRVLGVTALGKDIESARARAYAGIQKIKFSGAHWRSDIGS